MSVDSLPLEWDHTGDVGGSSSHEDDEEDEEQKDGGAYFSALSGIFKNKKFYIRKDLGFSILLKKTFTEHLKLLLLWPRAESVFFLN